MSFECLPPIVYRLHLKTWQVRGQTAKKISLKLNAKCSMHLKHALWDEVSLQSQIYYCRNEDRIIEFEDWGNGRTNKFADHALMFMLRGIHTNWKIPLSYNFCKSSTSGIQLVRCVKELAFNLVVTVYEICMPEREQIFL